MRREEIISKGAYTAPQFGELISVKQFIMLRRQKTKQLLLRLHNDRAEQADTVSFRVKQYDVKGNLVGTETVVERNVNAKPNEDFTPSRPIPLNAACVDFAVEMICAEYGDYTYRLHGNQLAVSYENRSDLPPLDKKALSKQMHGKSSHVSVRTLNAPKLLVASMAVILLIIGVFACIQLKNFMATEEFFTLDNVEYRFESDNHIDGPISIIGYTGKAGNIIIPAVIEGYPVVGIDDNAFNGRMLKSVTIKGDLKIGQRAFANCPLLDTVSIPLVTDLGKGAFADCHSLKNLTLCDEMTAIPDSAFEECTSLTEIALPSGLVSLGNKAFKGCEKLAEVSLPDTLAQVGKQAFTDCTSLSHLTAPYAGASVYGDDTIGYLFGGNHLIPASLTHIVITKATTIGESAFHGCGGAVSIQLPDTVTVIGPNAFRNCTSLTEIQLPASVISIGESAFHGCTSLSEITIPAGVSILYETVFAECSALKSVSLPRELKTIKTLAFENCRGLTQLDIPASVTSIQSNALAGCTGLEDLIIPFLGENVDSPAPLTHLFGDTTHGLKRLTVNNVGEIVENAFAGFDHLTTVSLDGTADFVGNRAFENCASLQTVLLPDSVTDIGEYAFAGCAALSAVDLPSELTVIREGMFLGCKSLWDVDIPDSVQSVESRAFSGCASLKEVAWLNSIECMGEYVFEGCTSLEWAALPSELTKVENGTFCGCTSLREITISPDTIVIGERAFYDCAKLETIPLSGLTEEIMAEAFTNCASLTSITLPVTVTRLGNWAFASCTSISELTIPDGVVEIGNNLIEGCSKLETLTIPYIGHSQEEPDQLTYLASTIPSRLQYIRLTNAQVLADRTFCDGRNLTTILLPTGLQSIGAEAFQNCTSLQSLSIPETVTEIGERSFSSCRSLKEITIPDSVTLLQQGIFTGCNALKNITVPFIGQNCDTPSTLGFLFGEEDIPASLTTITLTNATVLAAYTFDGCDRITSITLDCDLQVIGLRAFYNCNRLTKLSLPDTLEVIGEYAFENCSSLRTLVIPSSVTGIGNGAFYNCSSLRELELPFIGTYAGDNSTLVSMFGGWRENVPSTLKKVTLTGSTPVNDYAFSGCLNIQEIVLNGDMTSIGISAFSECYSLTKFEIPDTVESIGDSAFYNCSSLKSLSIPASVDYIGSGAFGYCSALEELEIPFVGNSRDDGSTFVDLFGGWSGSVPYDLKKVTVTDSSTIKDSAFHDCCYITDIVYDGEITAVGHRAFYNCSSLTDFVIPDTVTYIGDYAFYNCSELEEMPLPDGLEQIGSYAFEYCHALRSLSVPPSVSYIGYAAFGGCSALEELELPYVGSTPNDTNSLSSMLGGSWNAPGSLKKITISNSTTIAPNAFSSMQYLEEIIYTQEVTTIEYGAFNGCRHLRTLEIGNSLESIGNSAFYGCYSLKSFTIPETCTSIGSYAFSNTYALYEVYNQSDLTFESWDNTGVRNNCLIYRDNDEEVVKVTVDDFVLLLADDGEWYVIDYMGDETSLSFPATFVYDGNTIDSYRIAQLAFFEQADIDCVTIPEAVVEIRFEAFNGCHNLREVYNLSDLSITKGDYNHGYVAYNAYIVHTSIDEEPLTSVQLGDFEFLKSGDHWFLMGYCGDGGDIVLDSFMYEGKEIPAYEVFRGTFENRHDITSLVITDAVKYIAPYAFQNMSSLTRVVFEENDALTYIPEYAFAWCYELKQVTLHASLTEIASDAFWDCQSLREVYNLSDLDLTLGSYDHGCVALYAYIIHDSLSDPALTQVQIGDFQFLNSGDLWLLETYTGSDSHITLGTFTYKGVTIDSYSILRYAFAWNNYIEYVEIGDEVKDMERETFYNCTNLKSVSFEHNTSITTLRPYTFAYSYSLDRVILPTSLTAIENGAFWDCMNLLEVYNLSSLPLTCGDSGYGYVAYYAKVIHSSMDEPGLGVENVSYNGYTYKFICENGEWSLFYRIQHGNYDWRYLLPELTIDGKITPYRVDTDISGHSVIVIPASVSYINLNYFSGNEIYYGGTQAEFASLTEAFDVSNYSVRYYVDCVHSDNEWSYDANGNIISYTDCHSFILQEGNCIASRIDRFTCNRCNKTWDQEVNIWASHDLDENLVCRVCHGQFATYLLSDLWAVTNDGRYPFDVTEEGVIVSTNKVDGSSATIQLKAWKNMVVSYQYYVSTEDGCDVLIIRHNGETITRASGTGNNHLGNTLNVMAGDVITITYTKDGSVSRGEDLVKILNMVYLVEEAGDDNVES